MLIDAFMFKNEFKLLEARIAYLSPVVDYFILIESNTTFGGKPKELEFKNKKFTHANHSKIIHAPVMMNHDVLSKVDFRFTEEHLKSPFSNPSWQIEYAQMNYVKTVLEKMGFFRDENLTLMFSDIDDFPAISKLNYIRNRSEPVVLEQDYFMYNFNNKREIPALGTIVVNGPYIISSLDISTLRKTRSNLPRVSNAGWSFGDFKSAEEIQKKIKDSSHQEYNGAPYTNIEHITTCMRNGTCIYVKDAKIEHGEFEFTVPAIIVNTIGLDETHKYRNTRPTGDVIDITPEVEQKIKSDISVVCPTMWKAREFRIMLPKILDQKSVAEVILIDNNPMSRPEWAEKLLSHKKIRHFPQENNIFVNPAWNLGAKLAKKKKLCFLSDDVLFDPAIFDFMSPVIMEENGLIGMHESERIETVEFIPIEDNFSTLKPLKNVILRTLPDDKDLPFSFGCLFFMHKANYYPIPNELKINHGDFWLYKANQLLGKRPKLVTNFSFITKHHSTSFSSTMMKNQCDYEWEIADGVLKKEWHNIEDFIMSLSNRQHDRKGS